MHVGFAAGIVGGVLATIVVTTTATASQPPTTSELVVTEVGMSVEGRPIIAEHRPDPDGDPSDAITAVVIGVIHGDENAGVAIVDRLRTLPLPANVELHLIETMNPDGMADRQRTNANLVDLNRNFPYNWNPIGDPGNWQYAGPNAASEPETQAMVTFLSEIRPDLVIWYHQDLFTIGPAQGLEGEIRAHYAELTGLPIAAPSGGTYTGVAAQWARSELASNEPIPGVAFIVELGDTLSPAEAATHADAVLTVATDLVTANAVPR